MTFQYKGIKISISYLFIAIVGLFLINDRSSVAKNVILTTAIHELGHLTAMSFFNCVPKSISLQSFGIKIEKSSEISLGYLKETAIYFAGPAINLICAAVLYGIYVLDKNMSVSIYQAAVIHVFTACFNMLPIGVLDGGNILRCFLRKYTSIGVSDNIATVISIIFLLPAAVAAVMLFMSSEHNYTLIITCIYLTVMLIIGKGK